MWETIAYYHDLYQDLLRRYERLINYSPWLKSILPTILIFGVTLNSIRILSEEQVPSSLLQNLWLGSILSSLFVYLLLVAVYSNIYLYEARRYRAVQQPFHCDNHGTLWNDQEPNIAFRVSTFKEFLGSMKRQLGAQAADVDLAEMLYSSGGTTAQKFANEFGRIYDRDMRDENHPYQWDYLEFKEKLDAWEEYDSATGWGKFRIDKNGDKVDIDIHHDHKLLRDDEGQLFAQFLMGYCMETLSTFAEEHRYSKATLEEGPVFRTLGSKEGRVSLTFRLK